MILCKVWDLSGKNYFRESSTKITKMRTSATPVTWGNERDSPENVDSISTDTLEARETNSSYLLMTAYMSNKADPELCSTGSQVRYIFCNLRSFLSGLGIGMKYGFRMKCHTCCITFFHSSGFWINSNNPIIGTRLGLMFKI